jgi:hypothetical protein
VVPIQTVMPARAALSRWLPLAPLLLTLAGGCASVDPKLALDAAPVGTPLNVIATWQPNVQELPDRMNGGRPTPAVCGHVYLLQRDGTPIVGKEGRLLVSLFEEHPKLASNGTRLPLEMWDITPECLKLVQTKDMVGWGYALNLPWGTYRPDIGKVEMQVQYVPKEEKDGMRVFSDPAWVTWQNNAGNAQYAMQPHVTTNQLSSLRIPTGYGQSPPANGPGTLELQYPVNAAGHMVAQPQPSGGNQQGILQVQAVNPPSMPQPTGSQPAAMTQGSGFAPQGQVQGFTIPAPPAPMPASGGGQQGPVQVYPNANPQGQTVYTPVLSNRGQ